MLANKLWTAENEKETSGGGGDADVEMDVKTKPTSEEMDVKTEPTTEEMDGVDFHEYTPTKKKGLDDDEEEILGDYERERYGSDFVEMPSGAIIPIWEYLGPSWDERIV